MEYGYEKVLQVQRRCGVSFEDADRALKQAKGDVDKACTFAIRKKNQESGNGWFKKVITALCNFLTYRIEISKNGDIRFNIPMGIIIVIAFLYLMIVTTGRYWNNGLGFIFFVVFAIVVLTGHTLKISPAEKKEEKLKKVQAQAMDEDEVLEVYSEEEVDEQDDGYNSLEIK